MRFCLLIVIRSCCPAVYHFSLGALAGNKISCMWNNPFSGTLLLPSPMSSKVFPAGALVRYYSVPRHISARIGDACFLTWLFWPPGRTCAQFRCGKLCWFPACMYCFGCIALRLLAAFFLSHLRSSECLRCGFLVPTLAPLVASRSSVF